MLIFVLLFFAPPPIDPYTHTPLLCHTTAAFDDILGLVKSVRSLCVCVPAISTAAHPVVNDSNGRTVRTVKPEVSRN